MPTPAKNINKVATILHDWSDEDRQEAIDFAMHPGNGVTTIGVYLHSKGVKVSLDTVNRWVQSLIVQSDKVTRIRKAFDGYKGMKPDEINAFIAGVMAEALVDFREKVNNQATGINHRDIQALASLAKEARSSAIAMNTHTSSASMKELELGHALNFSQRLEGIFEGDDVVLERIKSACKAILVEIEGQY
jgi:hypothetical protein